MWCYRSMEPQNNRGWKWPLEAIWSNHCSKQVCSEHVTQGCVLLSLEHSQRWRFHKLSGWTVSFFDNFIIKHVSQYLIRISYTLTWVLCFTLSSGHLQESGSIFSASSDQVFVDNSKVSPLPFLLQAEKPSSVIGSCMSAPSST